MQQEGLRFERERVEYENKSPEQKADPNADRPAFTVRRPGSERPGSMEVVERIVACARKGCFSDPFPLESTDPGQPRKVAQNNPLQMQRPTHTHVYIQARTRTHLHTQPYSSMSGSSRWLETRSL